MKKTIPKGRFGRTGSENSRIIFGGAALSDATEQEADRALEQLLNYGVNHIDTAVTYGRSEQLIGRWMADHRKDFFLATKIDARTYSEARRELDTSLKDLQVDSVDLLQMHELVADEDTSTFLNAGGALRVLREAREQGLARYVGVTSHGFEAPRLLRRCIDEFDFDSVLLPFNFALSIHNSYRADFEALRHACHLKGIAVQTMKSIQRGPWGDLPRTRHVWYRPLEEPADIARAVHWVMSFDDVFLTSAGDVNLMPLVLEAAAAFDPNAAPDRREMEEMRARLGMTIPPQAVWPRVKHPLP